MIKGIEQARLPQHVRLFLAWILRVNLGSTERLIEEHPRWMVWRGRRKAILSLRKKLSSPKPDLPLTAKEAEALAVVIDSADICLHALRHDFAALFQSVHSLLPADHRHHERHCVFEVFPKKETA